MSLRVAGHKPDANITQYLSKINAEISSIDTNRYIVVIATKNEHGSIASVNVKTYGWSFIGKIVAAFMRILKHDVREQTDAILTVANFEARKLRYTVLPNVKIGNALEVNTEVINASAQKILGILLKHNQSNNNLDEVSNTLEKYRKLKSTIESQTNTLKADKLSHSVNGNSRILINMLAENSQNLESDYYRNKQKEIVDFVVGLLSERAKRLQTNAQTSSTDSFIKDLEGNIAKLRQSSDNEVVQLVTALNALKTKLDKQIHAIRSGAQAEDATQELAAVRTMLLHITNYVEDTSVKTQKSIYDKKVLALLEVYASVQNKGREVPVKLDSLFAFVADTLNQVSEIAQQVANKMLSNEAESKAAKSNQEMIDHIAHFRQVKAALIRALLKIERHPEAITALRNKRLDAAFNLITAPLLQASVVFEDRNKRLDSLMPLHQTLKELQSGLSTEKLQQLENQAKQVAVKETLTTLQRISNSFVNVDTELPTNELLKTKISDAAKVLLQTE